jgi:hypothetical protein
MLMLLRRPLAAAAIGALVIDAVLAASSMSGGSDGSNSQPRMSVRQKGQDGGLPLRRLQMRRAQSTASRWVIALTLQVD